MRLEEYTPETICRAMGLPSFSEDDSLRKRGGALRVVFMPSFHPELAVTLWGDESGLSAQVVALQQKLQNETSLVKLPDVSATVTVPSLSFHVLKEDFGEAYRSLDSDLRHIAIDGMSVAACHYVWGATEVFKAHTTFSDAIWRFSIQVVETAWSATADPRIANALAEVAGYLDLNLPIANLLPEPRATRLLILGTPDAREDYVKQIAQHMKRQE